MSKDTLVQVTFVERTVFQGDISPRRFCICKPCSDFFCFFLRSNSIDIKLANHISGPVDKWTGGWVSGYIEIKTKHLSNFCRCSGSENSF